MPCSPQLDGALHVPGVVCFLQLKVQIGSLVSTLEGERQLMQKYVSRVQDIRAALKT